MQKKQYANLHVLAASLCVFSILTYHFNIFCHFDQLIITSQQGIISGEAASPNKYRILVPYFNHFLSMASEKITGKPGYGLTFMLSIILFFSYAWYAFLRYIKLVFTDPKDLIISLFVFGVFLTAGMNHHSYQPWSYLEVGLFLSGAELVKKNKVGFLYAILCVIAVLNRETGIFLAFIPLFHKINKKNMLKMEMLASYIMVFISLATFLCIRLTIGDSTDTERITDIFKTNLEPMNLVLLVPVLVSGLLLFFLRNHSLGSPIKNSGYLFLLYLVPVLLFGRWLEIRMLLPFMYFIVPVIVYNILYPTKQKNK